MLILLVYLHVKDGFTDAFLEASEDNSSHSVQEPGCMRFDVLQQKDDPSRFVLHEVYRQMSDLEAHRKTPHFFRWLEAVPPMLAEPRYAIHYENAYPPNDAFLR
jgi:(4S)-4-hydroxy-5-phosphonooxypentane-2,3-dione isomerase